MEALKYRLVRDGLGFYSQEPIEVEAPVEATAEEETDLADLGGLQIEEPQEPKRKRRGRAQ